MTVPEPKPRQKAPRHSWTPARTWSCCTLFKAKSNSMALVQSNLSITDLGSTSRTFFSRSQHGCLQGSCCALHFVDCGACVNSRLAPVVDLQASWTEVCGKKVGFHPMRPNHWFLCGTRSGIVQVSCTSTLINDAGSAICHLQGSFAMLQGPGRDWRGWTLRVHRQHVFRRDTFLQREGSVFE